MRRRVYSVVAAPVNGLLGRLFHIMANDFDNNRRLHGAHFGSATQISREHGTSDGEAYTVVRPTNATIGPMGRTHRNVFAKSSG